MRCRIAFLSPRVAGTGNRTTSERIARELEHSGFTVTCYSSQCDEDVARLTRACEEQQVDLLLGLHAFRAGQHLLPLHRRFGLPLNIILGGTDVNEMVLPGVPTRPLVVETLAASAAVVSFTHAMQARVVSILAEEEEHAVENDASNAAHTDAGHTLPAAAAHAPSESFPSTVPSPASRRRARPRLCYIPQAVLLPPLPAASPTSSIPEGHCACGQDGCIRLQLGIPSSHFVFLLPCTLRGVKDPFYLAEAFERWHQTHSNAHLVIVGGITEEEFRPLSERYHAAYRRFHSPRADAADATGDPLLAATAIPAASSSCSSALSSSVDPLGTPPPVCPSSFSAASLPSSAPLSSYSGISWLPSLSPESLLLSLRCSSALVNSSLSEGQSGAILEAMELRVPIVARRNQGNESIVTHERTGLIFETPEECMDQFARVCAEWAPMSIHAPSLSAASSSAQSSVTTGERTVPAAASSSSELKGVTSSSHAASATSFSSLSAAASDDASVAAMVDSAAAYTREHHSVDAETEAYRQLIEDILQGNPR